MDNRSAIRHLLRHRELLKMEYEYDREQYDLNSGKIPLSSGIRKGLCWSPLEAGRTYYNSLNQFIIIVSRPAGEWPEHYFEYGRQVRFFSAQDGHTLDFQCTVSYVDGDTMAVAVPGEAAASSIRSLRQLSVRLDFDETSYRLMFDALSDVISAKGNRLAELRDIMLGGAAPSFRQSVPVSFPWLNRSQQDAVNNILRAKDVAVVHGPPGTGKTTTMVEAVIETLFRETQVLVCAQSNMAVDWICGRLMERGVSVLRIGNPARISGPAMSCSFEKCFEDHPDYPLLWSVRKALRERGCDKARRKELRSKAVELEYRITESLFSGARVIACTLAGSASRVMCGRRYGTLFIDEAAQALEAAAWIAIARADRIVFAGDHCQLPPTVKCLEALRGGLGDTLMQKTVQARPECVSLLTVQYRMHARIMEFSSQIFYDGRLSASPSVEMRDSTVFGEPVMWFDTSGLGFVERISEDGTGRQNRDEARMAVSVLKDFVTSLGESRVTGENMDFALISPYRSQVNLLRSLCYRDGTLRRFRARISVNTVDGFQGQEKDVVIISLVRSNDDGCIGFLNELRRMNVAFTRARYKVIIVGDGATMSRHPFYRLLYGYSSVVRQNVNGDAVQDVTS